MKSADRRTSTSAGEGGSKGRTRLARGLGLYLHVPFCERICPYCDFAVVAERSLSPEREDRYVAALLTELSLRARLLSGQSQIAQLPQVETVYFGGGTPALLRPESVARLLEAVSSTFPKSSPTPSGVAFNEVTLEANPSSLETGRLAAFRSAGVDRLSLGVQSFDDEVLRRLGRAHRAEASRRSLEAARAAGFERLSLDLIFAAPASSLAQLERDLDEIARHAPEHVSTYELTIEGGTPFALASKRGQLRLPDDDLATQMMLRIEERLAAQGLARYEQSSFARPGAEAQHNRRYWRREAVLGLGVGAWSSFPSDALPELDAPYGAREGNTRDLARYLDEIERGELAVVERDVPDAGTARGECVMLGLREPAGVSAAAFEREFGAPPRAFYREPLDELLAQGLLHESPAGDLALTPRGRLLADSVVARLL